MSMASSSFAARWRYDIFLSFSGEDARRSFVRHLYSALCVAGFRTFLDERNGENISLLGKRAIEESKLSIVVISRKYASSPCFLDILLKMKILECKEKLGRQVIPIFLDVDPSEVLGVFSQMFSTHDKRNEADSRVNQWRVALQMIGNINGWDLQNVEDHWHESMFIQKIVEDVSCKLSQMYMSTVLRLIGPEPPVTQFVSLLNMGSICNLTQLKPVCLINNNLNQLQLIVTNKLKSYPESIGSCFTLAELQANDNSIEEIHGSISNRIVRKQLHFSYNILSQGLNSASFDAKQGKGESSKMKVETFQKAHNLEPIELEKLPEHLLNLFPDTYEFEKETVVQLWVAGGFFGHEEGDRMEILANAHFDYLIEKKYVSPSRFDSVRRSVKYKITDLIHRFAPQVDYLKVEEAQLGSVSQQTQHLFLISKKINPTSFKILSKFEHLHTLLLFCRPGCSSDRLPQDLFLNVKQLRSLGLRRSCITEIPYSIGSLKYLRYLDVSETPIIYLPECIVFLVSLQTLKLDGCLDLVRLPLQLSKLAELRHLEFDIVGRLSSMPVNMRNLTSLQTLRAFVVGKEDGCRIEELKNLNNLNGSFCISGLENILTPHEAKEAAMRNKRYIRKLELRWRYHDIGSSKVEEEILDCLQPNRWLQELHIVFYCGTIFPDWFNGLYLCNIVDVTLSNCMNCLVLPSLGGLPLLKSLHIIKATGVEVIDDRFRRSYGNKMYHAFPKLEKLAISGMDGLKEWYGVVNGDFPRLSSLVIRSCPKLVALEWLSYLCSPKYLEISVCEEISSLGEKMLPSSLKFLSIRDCPRLNEKYCNPEASGWFQIAHVPSILIDLVERSMRDREDKGFTQS